jgi:Protein of unknown function (DUF5674)
VICIITKPATEIEFSRMSRMFGDYIKLAVDVERAILAGGAESHAECESVRIPCSISTADSKIFGALD